MDGRSILWSLRYLCLLLLVHCIRVACESYTYAQPDSYAKYPRWRTAQDGLAEFSFLTSQADALLFYLDSDNDSGNYLVIWLEGGRLKARTKVGTGAGSVLGTTFGEHLNDLNLHTLLIRHYDKQFTFHLDSMDLVGNLTYDQSHLQFQTRSYVYIGGLPSSHVPDYEAAARIEPLAGCVKRVSFADDSIERLQMEPRDPVTKHQLADGCVDRCATTDANCGDGGGTCVRSWAVPGGYFCDCSAATNVGQSCNTASSSHQMTLSGDSYYCYTLSHQPFTTQHDDIMAQLQPPLPHSGTILAGRSVDWTNRFNLYLRNYRIHYESVTGPGKYVAISDVELLPDENYRISVVRSQSVITIKIQSVSSTNQIVDVDTIDLELSGSEVEPVFPLVCVGGGDMETPTYEGTLVRVFVGHVALFEPQNSFHFMRKQVLRADLIHLSDDPFSPPLTFTKHGLRSDEISFQFRLEPVHGAGILLIAGNDSYTLTISITEADSGDIILVAAGLDSLPDLISCDNIFVLDHQWHLFQLKTTISEGKKGLVITVDHNATTACRFFTDGLSQNFEILESESSTLQLGPTTSGSLDTRGTPTPFLGCFQHLEFVTDSVMVRPNLEVPILRYDRFSGSESCHECVPGTGYCFNGGICKNTGAFQNNSCDCPEILAGERCDDISITDEVPSSSPSPSTPSTPGTTTGTSSPTTNLETTPTDDPGVSTEATSSKQQDDGVDYDAIGQWVGIATAIILVLILLVILMVFFGCFVRHQRMNGYGYYHTNENQSNVTLPHFSASLKTAHSHTLNLEQNRVTAITNGRTVHPTYSNGEKEFYI